MCCICILLVFRTKPGRRDASDQRDAAAEFPHSPILCVSVTMVAFVMRAIFLVYYIHILSMLWCASAPPHKSSSVCTHLMQFTLVIIVVVGTLVLSASSTALSALSPSSVPNPPPPPPPNTPHDTNYDTRAVRLAKSIHKWLRRNCTTPITCTIF